MKNYEIVFESEHINYIKITKKLVSDYLDMVNDYDVQKCISSSKDRITFTKEQELEWIENKLKNKACIFSMIEKDTNSFIGNIEIMNIENKTGELGIAITPKQQNKQFGQEALKTVIDYGFNILNLKEIYLKVYDFNKRAIHCYEKIGFNQYRVDEKTNDIYMKILK